MAAVTHIYIEAAAYILHRGHSYAVSYYPLPKKPQPEGICAFSSSN